ncbi:MAG: putative heat shock protein HSP90-family, partial [Frankiales bacterium]|nr:putative heat shock protein HSP90-family [Frankiales bacterium]
MRQAVLAGWAASPARFREDANAEEDAVLGAYRDRLLVELLQNAADAAAEAGIRARVLVRLTDTLLEVANTGAALTAAGVLAASTLRASAKRAAGSVGHFGVGFTAVLSVTSAPELVSSSGGVRWSQALTQEAVAELSALDGELRQRGGQVPVLRLPFPVAGPIDGRPVPPGYDTVVRLPLTPQTLPIARQLVDALDPTLLLVLPALGEVVVDVVSQGETRVFSCEWDGPDAILDGERWNGVVHRGAIPAALLATRGVEEQARDSYEVRVLTPEGAWPQGIAQVLRAPQPTDEPLSLPAFVIGSLPVDPGRRRVAPGPLADMLLEDIAHAIVELAERTGDLRLVPTGLAAGPVDAAITDTLRGLLPEARMLPGNRRGADAALLDLGPAGDAVSELLSGDIPALLPLSYTSPRWSAARRVLGVREIGAGELVEMLAGLARPPQWWAALYPALATISDRDALAALPVPLADGRTVTGPRGVLVPGRDLDAAALTGLALRLAHPDVSSGAAGELLLSLGATPADPAVLLADPAITDDDIPYEAALALVAALAPNFTAIPDDLGVRLLLPGDDGDLWPAAELLLPGGPLARVVKPDGPFGELAGDVAAAYDPEVLEAAGVLRSFGVLRAEDVLLDPDEPLLLELDGSDDWIAELPADTGPVAMTFVAIRDLELVRWPDALAVLAGEDLRADVLGSPYTRWWLANHPVMPGELLPGETALPGELSALFDAAPPGIDADFLAAIGVRTNAAALTEPADLYDLLDRVADPGRALDWAHARRLYLAVAAVLISEALKDQPSDQEPPDLVCTPAGVVKRDRAVVVDRPDLLPLLGSYAPVRVPVDQAAAVARMLGLRLATSVADYEIVSRDP